MPSSSLQQFIWNLEDVERLQQAHDELNPDGRGRRALGHITRSGLVMLCAAWELYFEDLIKESADLIVTECQDPKSLPVSIKKKIVKEANAGKDELSALSLCNDGWGDVLKSAAEREVARLNTPKSEQLGVLAQHYLGVENISEAWSIGPDGINQIVSARGDVAHRGRNAEYIPIGDLDWYKNRIHYTVIETDDFVSCHIKDVLDLRRKPWRARRLPDFDL